MAIDRIPGVGPQNTDIATAVAAAVPTIAAITSSITTNAASAGVTMAAITSSITTNAASAGLTNASITSAGNAAGWGATGPTTTQIAAAVPTLAQITTAITTNAASAGVTNASIASTVAANAGGQFSGTWTTLGYAFHGVSPSTSLSASGLSGYKYLRVITTGYSTVNAYNPMIRFNGDTANNYFVTAANGTSGNTATGVYLDPGFSQTNRIWLTGAGTQIAAAAPCQIDCIIPNSNSAAVKFITFVTMGYTNAGGSVRRTTQGGFSIYTPTSAISSIELTHNGGTIDGGYTLILGGN
jgi:hypothetical protein